jgi:hypothetical protein
MARKQEKLPLNVQLLQRRFSDAQARFDQQYQQRTQEYAETIGGFESRIDDYQAKAQAYMDDFSEYSKYLDSFFIEPETNTVQSFVKRGDQYYWADDIAPGFDLTAISNLGSLAGGEYEFVKTGDQKHTYAYMSYELIPSGKWENQAYTAYQTQYVTEQKLVSNPNPRPGQSIYSYETVRTPKTVPVTKYRMTYVDTSTYDFVSRIGSENLSVGYLKTKTPEGEFTTMRPEDFRVRAEPEGFAEPAPVAPASIDVADIRGELEEEKTYLQREVGKMGAASRQARMRQRVRPLLAETGEA